MTNSESEVHSIMLGVLQQAAPEGEFGVVPHDDLDGESALITCRFPGVEGSFGKRLYHEGASLAQLQGVAAALAETWQYQLRRGFGAK